MHQLGFSYFLPACPLEKNESVPAGVSGESTRSCRWVLRRPPPGWICRVRRAPREGVVSSCGPRQDLGACIWRARHSLGAYLPFLASSSHGERTVEPRPFLSSNVDPEGHRAERQPGRTRVARQSTEGSLAPRLRQRPRPFLCILLPDVSGRHCPPTSGWRGDTRGEMPRSLLPGPSDFLGAPSSPLPQVPHISASLAWQRPTGHSPSCRALG